MTDAPLCVRCGKKGTTMSMSIPGSGSKPTLPICLACFTKATKQMIKDLKSEREGDTE